MRSAPECAAVSLLVSTKVKLSALTRGDEMSRSESYKQKTFTVVDPDARIRRSENLSQFVPLSDADPSAPSGVYQKIPQNTEINIDDFRILPTGATNSMIFVHCLDAVSGTAYGWTSSRNLKGRFVNETLGESPPVKKDKKGPNAAWAKGRFLGQITLVKIVDAKYEIEYVAEKTLEPWLDLVAAAAQHGIEVAINDAFRTYADQKILHDGYVNRLPGYNQAAEPGKSKHQSGIAFDINVPGGAGNPAYEWLIRNAPLRGFVRTVSDEPWHWEFDPTKAQVAVATNTFKTPNVTA